MSKGTQSMIKRTSRHDAQLDVASAVGGNAPHKRGWNRWAGICLLAAIIAPLSVGHAQSSAPPLRDVPLATGYRIVESGYNAPDGLYWVDNDRILFNGGPLSKDWAPPSVYLWDLRTNTVSLYRNAKPYSRICYSAANQWGRMTSDAGPRPAPNFIRPTDWMYTVSEGPFGQERDLPARTLHDEPPYLSPFACKFFPTPKRLPKNPSIHMGFAADEYFDFGPTTFGCEKARPIVYHPGKGRPPVELPFSVNEVSRAVAYSNYADAYVFEVRGCVSDGSPWLLREAWIVDRRGRATRVAAPIGPWGGNAPRIFPAKGGLIIQSTNGAHAEGIYFARASSADRVLAGLPMRDVAVSPDGCKVAAAITRDASTQFGERARLSVADICSHPAKGVRDI